ncbi:aminomethyltransferase GcvT [Peptoclostridium acidaminophilum DSM 3953]|uniref:Aminomethyltransferase n=2 Tax=Peptoclostridium acidaminophilum TaxID=1731 RepID=W8U806_PEPAC|nr:glycine cleavage system aminomethyltransferase GcvT [Peptoclostridium acidaminophilum]AAU84891.1 aminomethyltransferase [Peptoclostridium acidaminophilum]AHM57016.1 aminomethyltransferase GcvT [Peptoclostridium acidaminophilum DSM 3953]
MENVKKTALYDLHVKYGGKIIEFCGWALPTQYEGGGINAEHEAVRTAAGMFDVSHMGEVEVKGKEAEKFINYLVPNDITVLEPNQVLYTQFCYPHGGTVDDLLVYKYTNEDYLLVINAANVDKDYAWIVENSKGFDVSLKNISPEVSEIALQGPNAEKILQKLTDTDLAQVKFFYCKKDVNIGGASCLISRTGYTGEDGFEIYTSNEDVSAVWEKLMEAGKDLGIKPAGLGCRDTLRFEVALPLYGNELGEDISPLEAGLGYFVKLDKEADFIGKEALKKQKAEGLKRKLVGLELKGKGIARHECEVYSGDKKVGFVTTGYQSPSTGKVVALAIVDTEYTEMGTQLEIQIRKNRVPAEVVAKKFYNKSYKK